MKTTITLFIAIAGLYIISFDQSAAQEKSTLTIEKIMQDPKWMGTSPDRVYWSDKGDKLYFSWNPESKEENELFFITPSDPTPKKVSEEEEKNIPPRSGVLNKEKTKKVYSKNGDIYLLDIESGKTLQITNTLNFEGSPTFNSAENKILYSLAGNLFSWHIHSGLTEQLTDINSGNEKPKRNKYSTDQAKWLNEQQLGLLNVVDERKEKRDKNTKEREANQPKRPKKIFTGEGRAGSIELSPDEKFITYTVTHSPKNTKNTLVPNYVTESGYTEDINARTKVGVPYFTSVDLFIYDIENDTVYKVDTEQIPDIKKHPAYLADYSTEELKEPKARKVAFGSPVWSENGQNAIVNISSVDNKDRWIMLLNVQDGGLKILDHQHDEAWIGGPGIGWWGSVLGWMPDNEKIYFQSEETGYSHLYTLDIKNGKKKALTEGNFEIYSPFISRDKKNWYYSSNQEDSGERYFYSMPLKGGKSVKLTQMTGRNDVSLSPDEKILANRFSSANQPWELYIQINGDEAQAKKITNSQSEEFKSYPWRMPEFIKFQAEDGTMVPARLYLPESPVENGPAVIFVHGAGYLQNAHKWWSSYFREYMFHNLLVEKGYTVLDIDYRGSAGYGRDWRTAIYRHMGGKDLSDQVDGAQYLVDKHDVAAENIGIYGGSYGGFITLMALFTQPEVFGAGAALRSVTDWAHYNHGYTANILNTPVSDSLAYVKSSPIYYAEGLTKPLLMCHGMIDDNVHFQDVVRLAQRLIELGKENWELAVYPVERHGFVEPSSWTDEYKRIFKLFEENLK